MAGLDKKTEGFGDQAKGRIQEATGDLTGNEHQQRKGEDSQAKGKMKSFAGGVEDKVDDVKDSLTS